MALVWKVVLRRGAGFESSNHCFNLALRLVRNTHLVLRVSHEPLSKGERQKARRIEISIRLACAKLDLLATWFRLRWRAASTATCDAQRRSCAKRPFVLL